MRAIAKVAGIAAVWGLMMLAPASARMSELPVQDIQQALAQRGYSIGSIDGLWGRRSINALAAFQKAEGLPATGELDPATVSRLLPPNSNVSTVLPDYGSPDALPPSSETIDTRPDEAEAVDHPAAGSTSPAAEASLPATEAPPPQDRKTDAAPNTSRSSDSPPPPLSVPQSTRSPDTGLIVLALVVVVGLLWVMRRRGTKGKPVRAPTVVAAGPGNHVGRSQTVAPLVPASLRASLDAHNAAVDRAVRERGQSHARSASPPIPARSVPPPPASANTSKAAPSSAWVAAGHRVTIGKHVIDGGLIYVGQHLPQQRQPHVSENCLIDPRLPISGRGDPEGHSMGYWPSYAGLSADARKSYLDWLSGPRSDPSAYIGFVFLYLYGLERRLMLEPGAADAGVVVAEVTRLLAIYGTSGSFRRYAMALLAAHELRSHAPPEEVAIAADDGGYDVPLQIKAALGARVRDGRPIEPDLLLAYVMSHPETKVRTPARRAFLQLRELFAAALEQRYPGGLRVAAGRARKLKVTYTACSATFTVEIQPFGGDLPDITGRAEPLATGRVLFESCVAQLEDYSRALGRSAGLQPTLAVLAHLPAGFRRNNAGTSAEASLGRIGSLAESGTPCTIAELAILSGLGDEAGLGKAKLRVLASTLAAFGHGVTADPAFATRPGKPEEAAIVFPLAAEAVIDPVPSDAYRIRQAGLMLGMLVAMVDGQLDEAERRAFVRRIDADTALSEDERRRLKAEIAIHALQPMPLAEAMKRIKDLPERDRAALADVLIEAAAADGRVDAREVSMLERLFRRIGLDEASIYSRLHAGLATPGGGPDDDLALIIPPAIAKAGSPIPPPPAKAADARPGRIDASRLEAIRRETHVAAGILAGIFAEPEEEIDDLPVPEESARDDDDDAPFEGLDRRYGALVSEIRQRAEWSAADFEQLCRSAGLMPGAARQAINDWALDRFDELLLEDEEPIVVNIHCLPPPAAAPQAHLALAGEPRVSA